MIDHCGIVVSILFIGLPYGALPWLYKEGKCSCIGSYSSYLPFVEATIIDDFCLVIMSFLILSLTEMSAVAGTRSVFF